jgi:hypothetical protein
MINTECKEKIKNILKIENNIINNNMIKHFINALNHLILVEMDIKEWNNKKRQPKIIAYYRENEKITVSFDLNDFMLNKPFALIECIDAYGSAKYDVNGIPTIVLNTCGENENVIKRYPENSLFTSILTFCILYGNNIEVADMVISKKILPRKKFFIKNHMIGIIPKELKNIKLGGKNAFYFYPEERLISLRVDSKDKIPIIYRHKDSEDWISKPYIKINLENLQ